MVWNERRNLTTQEIELNNSTESAENSTLVFMADAVENSTMPEKGYERIESQVLNITEINGHDSRQKGVPLVLSSNLTVNVGSTASPVKKVEKKRSFKVRASNVRPFIMV